MFEETSSISENLSRGSPYKKTADKHHKLIDMSIILTERSETGILTERTELVQSARKRKEDIKLE
jgi:hypothetical protein